MVKTEDLCKILKKKKKNQKHSTQAHLMIDNEKSSVESLHYLIYFYIYINLLMAI